MFLFALLRKYKMHQVHSIVTIEQHILKMGEFKIKNMRKTQ